MSTDHQPPPPPPRPSGMEHSPHVRMEMAITKLCKTASELLELAIRHYHKREEEDRKEEDKDG